MSFTLLTTGNTKTLKGQVKGYMTFIMHLAPASLSGYNVCPMASKGCAAACLNTSGRGAYNTTQLARIRKTKLFFEDRDTFMSMLAKDIQAAERRAKREGFIPVIRLNGTSDIRWENTGIIDMFPHIQFYDYTKIPNRKNIPANYHLTFSRSESNKAATNKAITTGTNVAVVFGVKKGAPLPKTYMGRKVIDGDIDDTRFMDPKKVIVGLRGKGKARKGEFNGFVVTPNVENK